MVATPEVLDRLNSIEKVLSCCYSFLSDLKVKNEAVTSHPPKPESSDLVELAEAARRTFYSVDRFYAIHRTILPSIQQGKKRLFSIKDIDTYLESKKHQPLKKQRGIKFKGST